MLLENARISSKVLSEHEDIVIYVTVKITMCLLLLFKVYFLMYMYFFFSVSWHNVSVVHSDALSDPAKP